MFLFQSARQFGTNIQGDDFDTTRNNLEQCNAFKDLDGYILLGFDLLYIW